MHNRTSQAGGPANRLRRATMVAAALLVTAAFSVARTEPASADAYGELRVALGSYNCLDALGADLRVQPCWLDDAYLDWDLHIVETINGEYRYTVRNAGRNQCLTHFAASGRLGFYECSHAYADQRWGFRHVGTYNGEPVFHLRNKHSGKCLVANYSRPTQVFMFTCNTTYTDQLFYGPRQWA